MIWMISFVLLMSSAFAEVGKVTKVIGSDAFLMRGSEKITLSQDLNLEEGDELDTQETYTVIYLYPGTQVSLAKNTKIKLDQNTITEESNLERATSIIDLFKGLIRLQVTKTPGQEINQQVKTEGAAFAVRGTEFEVSIDEGSDVNLDVIEGQVAASSPYVHSFVPEYVKANEGLTFNHRGKKFARRKLVERFKHHPGFMKREEIRQKWKVKRAKRLSKKKPIKTSKVRRRQKRK